MQQTQVTTFTIMEYIKSHNLSLEDISSLSDELLQYSQEMIRNSLSEQTKIDIMRKQIKAYWSNAKINEAIYSKEFTEFLSKVSI